jgi:GT2 family glycosyltransferase
MGVTSQEARQHGAPTIAAVVVNWNGGGLAVDCVRSLLRQTLKPTLFVVDNASSDGSIEQIECDAPAAQVIRNKTNRGYAAANNQALAEAATYDYVLLINNDAVLTDADSLEKVVAELEREPHIAGACGRFEYPDGEFQPFYNRLPKPLDLATVFGFGRRLRPLARRRGLRSYFLTDADFSKPCDIEQPAFACVLARGEALRRTGPLNEAYPIFFNDVDYCLRWKNQGWTWRYFPEWRVVHHHGKSVNKLEECGPELLSSAVRFAKRNYDPFGRTIVTLFAAVEAAWMKYVKADGRFRVLQIARGETLFK